MHMYFQSNFTEPTVFLKAVLTGDGACGRRKLTRAQLILASYENCHSDPTTSGDREEVTSVG